jgi:hypothetical protein
MRLKLEAQVMFHTREITIINTAKGTLSSTAVRNLRLHWIRLSRMQARMTITIWQFCEALGEARLMRRWSSASGSISRPRAALQWGGQIVDACGVLARAHVGGEQGDRERRRRDQSAAGSGSLIEFNGLNRPSALSARDEPCFGIELLPRCQVL